MLKSLTVNNFKAFKEPVTIDFSATGNYTFNTEAVKDGIVKTAVMYGKNASGKSSLGLAIFDIVGTLTDNYISKENYANYENRYSKDMIISFEYAFSFNNKDVVYSYTKGRFKDILSEKLRINDKILVEYNRLNDKNKIDLNMKGAENTNLVLKQLKFSILRFIKSNVILAKNEENELFEKMYDFVGNMLLFWSLDTKGFVGYTPVSGQSIIEKIIKEENNTNEVKEENKTNEVKEENKINEVKEVNNLNEVKEENKTNEVKEENNIEVKEENNKNEVKEVINTNEVKEENNTNEEIKTDEKEAKNEE